VTCLTCKNFRRDYIDSEYGTCRKHQPKLYHDTEYGWEADFPTVDIKETCSGHKERGDAKKFFSRIEVSL
jgi:hypothetical protein